MHVNCNRNELIRNSWRRLGKVLSVWVFMLAEISLGFIKMCVLTVISKDLERSFVLVAFYPSTIFLLLHSKGQKMGVFLLVHVVFICSKPKNAKLLFSGFDQQTHGVQKQRVKVTAAHWEGCRFGRSCIKAPEGQTNHPHDICSRARWASSHLHQCRWCRLPHPKIWDRKKETT